MTPRRWLGVLLVGSTLLRLVWAGAIELGNDEAYYTLYTRQFDWSYVDHPPLVALLIAWGEAIGGPGLPGVRVGFILLFAGSTYLMFRLGQRLFGAWAGLGAALVLNVAGYFGMAVGAFALPDGPLLFFWLATWLAFLETMGCRSARRGSLLPWVWTGLAWGGALLSKYHAVLLPIGLLVFLWQERTARVWLRRPGPYLALAVGLLTFAPVIGWNAAHGWVSFAFQGGRGLPTGWAPRLDYLIASLAGQAAYLFPWIWLYLFGSVHRVFRAGRLGISESFLVMQALVPLGFFLILAIWSPTLPHWSLIGAVGLIPLAGRDLASMASSDSRRLRRRVGSWVALPICLGLVFSVHASWGVLTRGGLSRGFVELVVRLDPTREARGWRELASELKARGLLTEDTRFVFTSQWYHSAQLAAALGRVVPVNCYSVRKPVGFATWSDPGAWVGGDGLLVVAEPRSTEPAAFERWFERIEFAGEIAVRRGGRVLRTARVYRCVRQLRPFPYGGIWREGHGQASDAVRWALASLGSSGKG